MNVMQLSVNNCRYSFHLDTANRYHVMLAWEPREHWGHSYREDDKASNVWSMLRTQNKDKEETTGNNPEEDKRPNQTDMYTGDKMKRK